MRLKWVCLVDSSFSAVFDDLFTDQLAVKMQIPEPPESGPNGPITFLDFEHVLAHLQAFAKDHGFAVITIRTSNKDTKGKPTWVDLGCDRGKKRKTEGVGLRTTSTARNDCPWAAVARTLKEDRQPDGQQGHWTFRLNGQGHNHGPSLDSTAHRTHCKLTAEMTSEIEALSKRPSLQHRDVVGLLQ